ncbi:MAG: TonB family protein [Oligoflexia bacterium]|nr:TonB family protein [Oligoflexia bacterium]
MRYFETSSIFDESVLFKRMVIFSLIFHVTIILFMAIKTLIVPHQSLNLDQAVRVDIVDLPDKIVSPPQEKLQPTEKMKAPEAKTSKEKAKDAALAKIKKMAKEEERLKKIEKMKRELEAQESAAKIEKQKAARASLLKGNMVSPGTALTGLQKIEFDEYKGNVQTHVQTHWNLPEWLSRANLRALAVVHLDPSGNVVKRYISKSSGDERFDALVLKTIDDSTPFPPPPEKFRDLFRVQGLSLGFPQ